MCKECLKNYLGAILDDLSSGAQDHGVLHVRIERLVSCSYLGHPVLGSVVRRDYQFPETTVALTKQTVILVCVCSIVHRNLQTEKVCTVRDIYYQDIELFRDQRVVQNAIDRLCRLLAIPRRLLNIVPSPNGLVSGTLSIVFDDETVVDIKHSNGPTIIPVGGTVEHITFTKTPKFILVVEKEAVFSHLASSFPDGILVTGKGFPDHYTRKFVIALSYACPGVPVYGLVDSDVHGILIMRTYQAGGERSVETRDFLDNFQFLGVSITDYTDGLVESTNRDKALATSTLSKDWIMDPRLTNWRKELQRGLFMGKKAEMNILDHHHLGRLSSYVTTRITEHNSRRKRPNRETSLDRRPKHVVVSSIFTSEPTISSRDAPSKRRRHRF